VLCPEEEYHEIGARMAADFFSMCGYHTVFIGCNTPKENILSAVATLKPDIIAIGVTNCLNLVSLKKIIEYLRKKCGDELIIAIGGSALRRAGKTAADFGADALIESFQHVKALREEIV
jgi:methanogenic corrinoid protein MtbC1